MRSFVVKVAVVLVSVLLASLLAEGLYSSLTGGSLLRMGVRVSGARTAELGDEERARVGELTPGPFAVDVDPRVISRMKASTSREIVGVPATTDSWGQRVRPGPEPEEGAQRIVILGDSVAFGFGVADDETYAHRLETMLADAVTSGPGPAVWTVACPGWNGVNALACLEGHLGRLDPDLVVYMATRNDLDDNGSVTETGHRTLAHSPRAAIDVPLMSRPDFFDRAAWMGSRLSPARQLAIATAGGRWWDVARFALYSRLGPESSRRWSELIASIRGTARRLATRDAALVVAARWDNAFLRDLELVLRTDDTAAVPVIAMLDEERPEDALEKDSHPNADCIRAGALVMARRLIEAGRIERADAARLPDQLPAYLDRVREDFTIESLESWRREIRARNAEFTSNVVDVAAGVGFHQVYGGLDEDGWVGRGVTVLLPGKAREIVARVTLMDESSGVFPLEIAATLSGASGSLRIAAERRLAFTAAEAGTTTEVRWSVPDDLAGDAFYDLHVGTRNWAIVREAGLMRPRAYRLLRLEVVR